MDYFIASLGYWLLLFLLGAGPAALLCPRPLRAYVPAFAPIVGFSILSFAGWYCYFLGLPGTDSYGWWLVAACLLLSLACFFVARKKGLSPRDFVSRSMLPVFALAALVFISVSLPMALSEPEGLTSISMGNNDIAEMAGITNFLKHFERGSDAGFLGQSRIWSWNADSSVFGGAFSGALFATIAGLQPYQVQNVVLTVFFFLSIPFVYGILVELLKFERSRALLVTAIFAANPVFIEIVYQGFMGQTLTTTISAALVLVMGSALNHGDTGRKVLLYIPMTVLASWAVIISYPHMLPFVLAPLIAFSLFRAFIERTWRPIRHLFMLVGLTILILAAMSWHRVYAVYTELLRVRVGNMGGFVPLQWPDMILGLGYSREHEYGNLFFHVILSAALVAAFLIGCIKQWRKDRKPVLLSLSVFGVVLGGVLVLALREIHGGIPGGYRSFKLLSFFMPLIIPCAFLWVKEGGPGTDHRRWIIPVLAGMILLVNGYNTASLAGHLKGDHLIVGEDLVDLRRVEENPKIESVNMLLSRDFWQMLWANHFLTSKKQYFELATYAGRKAGPLNGRYDLRRLTDYEHGDIYHFDLVRSNLEVVEREKMIPVNNSFALAPRSRYRIDRAPEAYSVFSIQASIRDNGKTRGGKELILSLDIGPTGAYADFRIKFPRGLSDRRKTILWNDSRLSLRKRHDVYFLYDLPLQPGRHILILPLGKGSKTADGFELLDVALRAAESAS